MDPLSVPPHSDSVAQPTPILDTNGVQPVVSPAAQAVVSTPTIIPSSVSPIPAVPVTQVQTTSAIPPASPAVIPPITPPTAQTHEEPVPAVAIGLPQQDPHALAQPIVAAQANIADPMMVGGAVKGKETGPVSTEVQAFVEVVGSDSVEKEPLPPEVSSWMEKVSRDTGGEQPPEVVVADATVQNPTGNYSNEPVFVLPLGQVQMQAGLHQNVNDSVRWLAEWCKKIAKKLGGHVAYNG